MNRIASVLLVAVVALSCGEAKLGGGISGTSMVVGSISGLGSIVVGGIDFDTGDAIVTIEGNPATPNDLQLGMVASVLGVVDGGSRTGVAERVAVENVLTGPLETVDVQAGRLGALGQTIVVDQLTVFDPTSLATLQPGDAIEVSGFFDAERRIRATRVSRPSGELEIEVQGEIEELDVQARLFRLGGVWVDYQDAAIEGVPASGLVDGLVVEVEAAAPPSDGTLVAVSVEVVDLSLAVEEGDGVSLEGFVTSLVGSDGFVLGGTRSVRISTTTRFEGGDRSDLELNARVEVEGALGADGVLDAEEVEFLRSSGAGGAS